MVEYKRIAIVCIIMTFSSMLFPQSEIINKQMKLIKSHNPIMRELTPENLSFIIDETSEMKLVALWFIRFYQNFISSQHDNHQMCTFVPSCSRFGVSAIKSYGIVKGILITADRIQRCNPIGSREYILDSLTNKRVDPASQYQNILLHK